MQTVQNYFGNNEDKSISEILLSLNNKNIIFTDKIYDVYMSNAKNYNEFELMDINEIIRYISARTSIYGYRVNSSSDCNGGYIGNNYNITIVDKKQNKLITVSLRESIEVYHGYTLQSSSVEMYQCYSARIIFKFLQESTLENKKSYVPNVALPSGIIRKVFAKIYFEYDRWIDDDAGYYYCDKYKINGKEYSIIQPMSGDDRQKTYVVNYNHFQQIKSECSIERTLHKISQYYQITDMPENQCWVKCVGDKDNSIDEFLQSVYDKESETD